MTSFKSSHQAGSMSETRINKGILKNMSWGVLSNVLQILFITGFYVIIARHYNAGEFAQFLISTTVYQIVAAFSSLGLGQWFVRQYASGVDKQQLISDFLKTQSGLGLIFYLFNIGLAYLLYDDAQIRLLCIILGTNILFDNLISAIKTLNIAEGEQRKTAVILSTDGFLKLLAAAILFVLPLSPAMLAIILVGARVLTMGVFIRLGTSAAISIKTLFSAGISATELKFQVINNWRFIIIGSISIVYWRLGNIIISKMLTLKDVADYEIAFRILSVLLIVPVVASATIYPRFINLFSSGDAKGLKEFYHTTFRLYCLFSVAAYAFVYCFADLFIPLFFGPSYPDAAPTVKQMFLTYLLFPTVLLQANLLVAMGLEKMDMRFNILSLIAYVVFCIGGLYFIQDLAVINYSVFSSFVLFHILQDAALIRKGIASAGHCMGFYAGLIISVIGINYSVNHFNPYLVFVILVAAMISYLLLWAKNNNLMAIYAGNLDGGLRK